MLLGLAILVGGTIVYIIDKLNEESSSTTTTEETNGELPPPPPPIPNT